MARLLTSSHAPAVRADWGAKESRERMGKEGRAGSDRGKEGDGKQFEQTGIVHGIGSGANDDRGREPSAFVGTGVSMGSRAGKLRRMAHLNRPPPHDQAVYFGVPFSSARRLIFRARTEGD